MQATIKRVHIISRFNGGWAVKKQGAARALKIYPTKEDAVLGSYALLQGGYDLVIHRKDGSVEQWKKAESLASNFFGENLAKKAVTYPKSYKTNPSAGKARRKK
ncbi:MAG: DUF2188 domain-containing protein [Bacteroidetes bacterium]|nr:DUF2188 domain-containing protein [Bacteroidota bacterium]